MITGWEYPKDISNPFPLVAALYPTPTKVRVFLYPSCTPLTILLIKALVVPWIALINGSSLGLSTVICPSSNFIVILLLNSFVNVPFGPFTVTTLSFTENSTPEGTAIGFLPTLDINVHLLSFYYQTNARTSPPTFSALATLSVITPFEVETIAIPRPDKTLGISSTEE